MHYKNIYIRDFGIFNNQKLNNISENLVVIGGKNRAGKSTFLKLLRYLPYGLPQDNSIPPAKNKHYIEAELIRKNKVYNLFLDGFADPKVKDKTQNQYSAAEIFNNLDQLSYQQLFTISLDELQQLSKIAEGKREKKRLFSLLLGAGMSELVKVPELADRYFNQAKNIGGVLGDPSVALFKPYFNEIQAAEDMRDRALLEIKEFNRKRDSLKENKKKLREVNEKIQASENKFILLDLLKNNYRTVEQIEKLKLEIKNLTVAKNSDETDLTDQGVKNKIKEALAFIKSQSQEIETYQQKQDILQEKVENYKSKKNKLKKEYQNLIFELEDLNCNWEQPLKELKKIEADLIKDKQLNRDLKKFEKLKTDIGNLEENIKDFKLEVAENNTELKELNFKDPADVLKRTYFFLGLSLTILTFSFFIDYNQVQYLALISALTAYIYYSSNYKNSKMAKEQKNRLKKDSQHKNKKIKSLTFELNEKRNNLKQLRNELTSYAEILGVSDWENFSFLTSYFREIKDKKRRYKKLKAEEKENERRRENIEIELKNLYDLIKKSARYLKNDFNLSFNQEKELRGEFNNLYNNLNSVAEIKNLATEYESKKNQLKYTLSASEKTKTALAFQKENKDDYQTFINYFRKFSSLAAVKKEKDSVSKSLNSLKNEKERLEEKITTLKNEINKLSSSNKIEQAQHKINQAQNDLEKKAQRYAVNKSVYYILKKLRSRMIEKAENELLKPASEVLAEISSHHYKNLETTAELEKSDFKTTTANGKEFKSVSQLSRGSLEQLFLAVRISRIKEITPPLPLILDDSLVNFDSSHLYNAAKVISKLAEKHQIFILSCHPHLISYISRVSDSAQYWKLEKGNFELSNQKKLLSHLSL